MGFVRDIACPNMFVHVAKNVYVDTHADDDYGTGPRVSVAWFEAEYKQKVKLKSFDVHDLTAEYAHLRRRRLRTREGMAIIPDAKHIVKVQALLGMTKCGAVPTPMVAEI